MTEPNDPAFTTDWKSPGAWDECTANRGEAIGLTKREWFAGMVMLGIQLNIVTGDGEQWKKQIPYIKSAVACCVEVADALIAELSKETKP